MELAYTFDKTHILETTSRVIEEEQKICKSVFMFWALLDIFTFSSGWRSPATWYFSSKAIKQFRGPGAQLVCQAVSIYQLTHVCFASWLDHPNA